MLRVNGGPANSGTVVKRVRGDEWTHECDTWLRKHPNAAPTNVLARYRVKTVTLAGYWTKCPDCLTPRPRP